MGQERNSPWQGYRGKGKGGSAPSQGDDLLLVSAIHSHCESAQRFLLGNRL